MSKKSFLKLQKDPKREERKQKRLERKIIKRKNHKKYEKQ